MGDRPTGDHHHAHHHLNLAWLAVTAVPVLGQRRSRAFEVRARQVIEHPLRIEIEQRPQPFVQRHFNRLFVQQQMIQRAIPALQLRQVDLHPPTLLPARHIAAAVAVADVIGLQPIGQGVFARRPRQAVGDDLLLDFSVFPYGIDDADILVDGAVGGGNFDGSDEQGQRSSHNGLDCRHQILKGSVFLQSIPVDLCQIIITTHFAETGFLALKNKDLCQKPPNTCQTWATTWSAGTFETAVREAVGPSRGPTDPRTHGPKLNGVILMAVANESVLPASVHDWF